MNRSELKYNGNGLHPTKKYLPSPDLVNAVNLAIQLERPLLLKGEPGCGKTTIAHDVAQELGLEIEVWNVKSTSRASDGLYHYDNIARLRDSQRLDRLRRMRPVKERRFSRTYIKFGPLGRAFTSNKPKVILIDEIDKADIDFPNDLLFELDENCFEIIETGEKILHKHKPLLFITSNSERDLPDAFLRRCLFHYIEFPTKERLADIINLKFGTPNPELVTQALDRFWKLREGQEANRESSRKKVSTSELIDWFAVLQDEKFLPQDEIIQLLKANELPFSSVLLKSKDEIEEQSRMAQTTKP